MSLPPADWPRIWEIVFRALAAIAFVGAVSANSRLDKIEGKSKK